MSQFKLTAYDNISIICDSSIKRPPKIPLPQQSALTISLLDCSSGPFIHIRCSNFSVRVDWSKNQTKITHGEGRVAHTYIRGKFWRSQLGA
jgi:hypothetical protein